MALLNFQRICQVTIARQPTGFVGNNPTFFDQLGNATLIEYDERNPVPGLRIQFEVKRDLGKTPNKCKITITNLAPASRIEAERKPTYVILSAGHDGVARLLFTGNIQVAWSELKGTDWETYLILGDGADAFANARLNKSYKEPIDVLRVVTDCASSFGLKLPPEIEQSADLRQALKTGISVQGPTRDTLTRVLAPYGYGWSFQNGKLQILRSKDTVGQDILVTQDTGLQGSPTRTTPNKKTGVSEVTFDNVLNPDLGPGTTVKLDSKAMSGRFKITDATSKGDTRGSAGTDWSTSIKASPL